MKKLNYTLNGRSSDIFIGHPWQEVKNLIPAERTVIITDSNLSSHYSDEYPDCQILTLASAPDLIAQYSVDSAHLAVRRAATQETVYQNDAFLQDVSYMLDYTTFGPNHEQEDEYKTKLYEAISAVETGSMTPHAALAWLETELQATLGSELEIDTAPCFYVYLPLTLKSFGP